MFNLLGILSSVMGSWLYSLFRFDWGKEDKIRVEELLKQVRYLGNRLEEYKKRNFYNLCLIYILVALLVSLLATKYF